ncbi:uncharacterized protein yc1106_04995 [Curvularia clavata]|uniref:DUF6536 domain-containing protein n=1 Tax=Curvularia clavata TaxID=95742 RepID=A0A9Q9DTS6_CURCL|nr:uncharacterized protein yc1106_04995 [Curvularia clavata]
MGVTHGADMDQAHLLKRRDVQHQPFLAPDVTHTARKRQKWQKSLYMFALLGCVVLIVNTTFLLWAVRMKGIEDGLGILYEASCDDTKWANIGVHLLINILSSSILAASNYCMQCLSAPLRSEIDNAHRRGKWLDIGIPSLRNVLSSDLGKHKKIYWWILGLSSFPLHLCYNSVIFKTTSAQTYGIYKFGPEAKAAIEAGRFNNPPNISSSSTTYGERHLGSMVYAEAFKADRLEVLSPLDCINEYSIPFQPSRGNVFLLVDEGLMPENEIHGWYNQVVASGRCSAYTGTAWIYEQFDTNSAECLEQNTHLLLPQLRANSSIWAPLNSIPVRSCLSEPTHQKCTLKFSVHLITIVIIFNIVKILAILGSIRTLRNDPMLTVGDAIASFLRDPDTTADKMCLLSQQQVHRAGKEWPLRQEPRAFTGKSLRCLASGISVLIYLFVYGYNAINGTKDLASVLRIGLGSVDARTIVRNYTASSGLAGVFENVIIANTPQVIISLIYFSYNATITSMLLSYEWSSFFTRRKPLRVSSSRQGRQRSTYFLQLPYRYALPLLAFSTLLHWLSSQSLFVVSVQVYNMYGQHNSHQCVHWEEALGSNWFQNNDNPALITCGADFITLAYCPLGILLSVLVAIGLAIGMVVLGMKKLSPAPVVGSCSAAIAASCHTIRVEDTPWEKELQWGEILVQDDPKFDNLPPHCGLSSEEVIQPSPGQLYT